MEQVAETPVRFMFADILEEAGIEYVFGMPGGCTPFLFDALVEKKDTINTVLARHEGGAAVMADLYARLTGKPALLLGQGAFIGTSGGYGIIETLHSGLPMVIVCDTSDYFSLPLHGPYQNGTGDYGSYDLPNMMKGMTKYCTVATNPSEFVHGLQQAVKHAVTGRPGPAAVLIKWNVAFANTSPDLIKPKLHPIGKLANTSLPDITENDASKIADMLIKAKNPVVICGQGARNAGAASEIIELAELAGLPVATSYLGKGVIPETHPCSVGTMGAIGQKAANALISDADLLLTVGSSLAPDNTKWLNPDYINTDKTKIIQIDLEPRNMGWTYPVEIGVTADAKLALTKIISRMKNLKKDFKAQEKIKAIENIKQEMNCFSEEITGSDAVPIAPERVVREINRVIGEDDLLVLDGGNNRMWFTHHFQSKRSGQILAGGGVAAIGYAPVAALAAQLVHPDKRILAVCGDGGMLMQLYTLEMARDMGLPVTYVILNNSCLGNVRDFQAPDRRIATEYSQPNFAKIASGFDMESARIEKPEKLFDAIERAHKSRKPYLVEIIVDDLPHFKLMG